MRIAVIGPTHPYKGGIAQHTTELCHRLAAAGHDVELVSWAEQYPDFLYPGQQRVPDDQPELPVFPRTSQELSWRRPAGWVRTGRRLGREADLVVPVLVTPMQAPSYAVLLTALRRSPRRPRVVALTHNVLPHESRAVDRPLVRLLLAQVDGVLVHTDAEAAVARGLTGARVETATLPAALPVAAPVRAAGEQPAEPRRHLLFFGLVRPYKGVDVLLEALAKVPDVSLTIAGEIWGGLEPLQRMVGDLGLDDRVTIQSGYVPAEDIPDLFAQADALVLPYRSGTASTNVLVAHAHGVPVVATSLPSFVARVRDGVDGLLCRPGDAGDLARALTELYAPGRLAQLRVGIRDTDNDQEWTDYLAALTGAGTGEADRPETERSSAVQVAAPPGGRLLAVAKRAAEQGLWARVAAQGALERRTSRSRVVPELVPPTAVLSTREQYEQAAAEARRLRLPLHRDRPKNWDALGAVGVVLRECGRSATVLDAGSARYSSVLPWLRLYGLTDLTGINLEFGAEVRRGSVRFRHGDITDTGFETGSFDAITCMSVIEHGVPIKEFLAESARLLRRGGILSVSTDYDQSPPDTTGVTAYGVPVHIFGPDEIRGLVETAAGQGLALVGDLQLEHQERPVHWKRTGLDYTFILLSFRRE